MIGFGPRAARGPEQRGPRLSPAGRDPVGSNSKGDSMKLAARFTAFTALCLMSIAGLASAAPATFTFDRAHTEIGFNIRHFFTKVHGRFDDYDGTLGFAAKSLAASSVQV